MPRGNCNHRRDKNAVLLKSMDRRDSEIEMEHGDEIGHDKK